MAQQFAGMEILGKLGEGGMGTVYKARRLESGQVVALKVLQRMMAASPAVRERFLREGRTMAKLRHRNIVSIYEMNEANGTPYIAMEFVDGRALSDILKEGIPQEQKAATWALKIAYAVGHAHSHGVIHRDLKPGNIIIDRDGEPVVMDFGLAKDEMSASGLTQTDEVVGTPSYMSPEQAGGKPLDVRSDIYSLGAVLYALLTGQPPFSGPQASIYFKVVHREPEAPSKLNPDVSRDLETICFKAMRKTPEDRYQQAGDMAADLAAFLEQRRIQARPESIAKKLWRAIRRRKKSVMASAAVCVLGLAGVGAFLMIRDNLPSPVVARATAPESSASPAASPGATGVVSSTTVSVTGTTLSPTGLAGELKKADDLLLQKKYAEAVRVYDKLLAGSLDATQKKDVEQRLTWAKQLRDRAAVTTTTVPTLPADAAAGKTVAEGDRLLATCKFEEAAATYQALKADADRQEIAARLLALRGAAAQALSKGTLMPVVLKDNKRGTVCSIGRAAAQLADTGGAVSARRWDALDRDDIYRVYRACLPQPTPAQRLDLGLLCKALGLKTEMQAEFDQAAQDATQKPLVDRFAKVALTP